MKHLVTVFLFLLFSILAHAESVISVGHSLLGHPTLPAAFNALVEDAGTSIEYNKTQNNPGATLWFNYENPGSSHVDNYEIELSNHVFDVFIVTEAIPIESNYNWSETNNFANLFYEAAINNNPNSDFYVWQTWGYISEGIDNCDTNLTGDNLIPLIGTDLKYWEAIADAVSNEHGSVEVPVMPGGNALVALNEEICAGNIDNVSRIEDLFADTIHLNDNGWYFMALVQYATIYKKSPVGLTSNVPSFSINLSSEAVTAMQEIAWDAVCGYARSGACTNQADSDNDGIADSVDNCPLISNPAQENTDGDSAGDACDNDDDADGIEDNQDNCPLLSNPTQSNLDKDLMGDACDSDDDNDNVEDSQDNCPMTYNPQQEDENSNGIGGICEQLDEKLCFYVQKSVICIL